MTSGGDPRATLHSFWQRPGNSITSALIIGISALACTEVSLPLEMTGVEWRLDSIVTAGGTINATTAPARATLRLLFDVERHDRGVVNGMGPCNPYSGEYRAFGDGGLTIGNVQRTLMACMDARDELESAFLPRLSAVESYVFDGDLLTLRTTTAEQLLFSAP